MELTTEQIYTLLVIVTFVAIRIQHAKLTIPRKLRLWAVVSAVINSILWPIVWVSTTYNLVVYKRPNRRTVEERNRLLQEIAKQH